MPSRSAGTVSLACSPPPVDAGHRPVQEHEGDHRQEAPPHPSAARSHPLLHQIRIEVRERQPGGRSHNRESQNSMKLMRPAAQQGCGQQDHKHQGLKGSLQPDCHRWLLPANCRSHKPHRRPLQCQIGQPYLDLKRCRLIPLSPTF
jgi:hypothetical protein